MPTPRRARFIQQYTLDGYSMSGTRTFGPRGDLASLASRRGASTDPGDFALFAAKSPITPSSLVICSQLNGVGPKLPAIHRGGDRWRTQR